MRNENAGEESSKRQVVQQKKKICGCQARWGESCNQIKKIMLVVGNFKTLKESVEILNSIQEETGSQSLSLRGVKACVL